MPSEKAKIVGKLKKGQKLDVIYDVEDKGFYEVLYKGKKAYISNKYAQVVKPHKNAKWLGQYYDQINAGSGYYPNLTVYKQTNNKVYFASYEGQRTVAKNGYDWAYKYKLYKGTATIVSTNKASLKINGYKGTWTLKGNKIIPTQNAEKYVSDGDFQAVVPEYGEFIK